MLTAKFTKPESGYDYDRETCAELLTLGQEYEVSDVAMGQSHTSIYLKDFPNHVFNSVNFEFYKRGKLHNIFRDPRYNPYL